MLLDNYKSCFVTVAQQTCTSSPQVVEAAQSMSGAIMQQKLHGKRDDKLHFCQSSESNLMDSLQPMRGGSVGVFGNIVLPHNRDIHHQISDRLPPDHHTATTLPLVF